MLFSSKHFQASVLSLLCLCLLWQVLMVNRQRRDAQGVIRMHVVAVSDDETEQALKRRVSEAVTACVGQLLYGARDRAEACERIEQALPDIERAAGAVSEGRAVTASFAPARYPRQRAGTVSLPAGEYPALRVTLGEGAGHNWWGIVFPQLMSESISDSQGVACLSLDTPTWQVISGDSGGYVIRFRIAEWLQNLTAHDDDAPPDAPGG